MADVEAEVAMLLGLLLQKKKMRVQVEMAKTCVVAFFFGWGRGVVVPSPPSSLSYRT